MNKSIQPGVQVLSSLTARTCSPAKTQFWHLSKSNFLWSYYTINYRIFDTLSNILQKQK